MTPYHVRKSTRVSLYPVNGTCCFLEQETEPSLLTLSAWWQINMYVK